MALLRSGQRSQRLLLLRALLDVATAEPSASEPHTGLEEAWRLLAEADQRDTGIVEEVLMYPTVGVWARYALRQAQPRLADVTSNRAEFGYLHSIAAAAAIRCGLPCRITVPVRYGVVSLPTVGHVRLPTSFPVGMAEVHNTPRDTQVRAMAGQVSVSLRAENSGFTPAKRHLATARGLTLRAWIDDADPYRTFTTPGPPNALDPFDFLEWCKLLDEAWDILTRRHTDYARELAAALTTLVPIDPASGLAGASSAAAFGGIALPAKASAAELAETLVHEVQHSKLNALFSLVDLVHAREEGRFYAPWRDDPRPLSGMLQGIYAFVSVTEFWRVQRVLVREPDALLAHFLFAQHRHHVRLAVNSLRAAKGLTQLGHELLSAVSRRLEACEQEPVSPEVSDTVATMAADHYAVWRSRYLRPDPAAIDALATAWTEGRPATGLTGRGEVVRPDGAWRPQLATRGHLLRSRVLDPARFAGLVKRADRLPGSTQYADAAYCVGDYDAALAGYLDRIASSAHDGGAWAGLGLCLRARAQHVGATAVLRMPETVAALHRRVRTLRGVAPHPVALAGWLGTAAEGAIARPLEPPH